MQKRLLPILHKYNNVAIYACGHIHNFQHIQKKGDNIDYVVNSSSRSRAYMSGKYAKSGVRSDVSGEIGLNELSLNFILSERQKELASELTRRTDLIRFGKYTKGNNWDWKNGIRLGGDVDDKYQLFPIPESELTNNPALNQNDGYKQ